MHPQPRGNGDFDGFSLTEDISWWDPDAECTIVLTRPDTNPGLWAEYLRGAELSYRAHGVAVALDVDAIRAGADTAMFWSAIDRAGRVIGGVRAKGPLTSADDSHATIEWAGQPGLPAVRKMIDDRVPFGILEMKAAWIADDRETARWLSKTLARSGFHAMALTGIQFCMATSAPYILDSWRTSGGVVAPIAATPYPDERYRTKMMWWDQRTFARHAHPEQLSKILLEMELVSSQLATSTAGRTAAR